VELSRDTHVAFDQMPAELRQLLEPDLLAFGQLGEFFQRAAQQPEALAAFHRWTEALTRALPARLVQAIALTVIAHTGNGYEGPAQEERAIAQGLSDAEITALRRMRAGSCETLSDEEVAAAALARCLLEDYGRGCDAALLRLARLLGEPTTTACLMLTARFAAHATMTNAWGLRAADPASGA
jgi:alkylhydroperoxidase/carboxymuconolactone decarboxylase family protein YurZ